MEGESRKGLVELLYLTGVLSFISIGNASLQPVAQSKAATHVIEACCGPCGLVLSYDDEGNLVNVWEKIWVTSRALIQSSSDASHMQRVTPEYSFNSDQEKDAFELSLEEKSNQYVEAWYRLKAAITNYDLEQVKEVLETQELLEFVRFQKHLFNTLDDNLLSRLDRIEDQEKKAKLKAIRNCIMKKTGRRHNPNAIKFSFS